MGIFASRKEITPETILRRKDGLLFNEIDGEVVLMSIENSEYYGMSLVAGSIWRLLEQPISVQEIISHLMKEYEVTEAQCMNDTMNFLKKLQDKKLLT